MNMGESFGEKMVDFTNNSILSTIFFEKIEKYRGGIWICFGVTHERYWKQIYSLYSKLLDTFNKSLCPKLDDLFLADQI
jgi:hypothetical protein